MMKLMAGFALAVMIAGCEEVPLDAGDGSFPLNANVQLSSDVYQNYFVARVENPGSTPQGSATFEVTLFHAGLVTGSGSASTGAIPAGEIRPAQVAFGRQTLFDCFRWSVVAADGRRRSTDLIC